MNIELVLASSSPRRRELLDLLAINYRIHPVDIDESVIKGETATQLVKRLAYDKALAAHDELSGNDKALPVLGSDTVVEIDGVILGKPVDEKQAAEILMMLSGKQHFVYTSVAVLNNTSKDVLVSSNKVEFDKLNTGVIADYIATGEPMDKAGAYAVQGKAGQFIKSIQGSYSAIMGLPLYETAKLLNKYGINTLRQ